MLLSIVIQVKWAVYKHYLHNVGICAAVATMLVYIVMHATQIGTNFWLARWANDKNMVS